LDPLFSEKEKNQAKISSLKVYQNFLVLVNRQKSRWKVKNLLR